MLSETQVSVKAKMSACMGWLREGSGDKESIFMVERSCSAWAWAGLVRDLMLRVPTVMQLQVLGPGLGWISPARDRRRMNGLQVGRQSRQAGERRSVKKEAGTVNKCDNADDGGRGV